MSDDQMTKNIRHWWIYKGTSNFCNELIMADDCETFVRQKPEGFYDVVSDRDTIEGGVEVVEKSAYDQLMKDARALRKIVDELPNTSDFNLAVISDFDKKYPQANEKE